MNASRSDRNPRRSASCRLTSLLVLGQRELKTGIFILELAIMTGSRRYLRR